MVLGGAAMVGASMVILRGEWISAQASRVSAPSFGTRVTRLSHAVSTSRPYSRQAGLELWQILDDHTLADPVGPCRTLSSLLKGLFTLPWRVKFCRAPTVPLFGGAPHRTPHTPSWLFHSHRDFPIPKPPTTTRWHPTFSRGC